MCACSVGTPVILNGEDRVFAQNLDKSFVVGCHHDRRTVSINQHGGRKTARRLQVRWCVAQTVGASASCLGHIVPCRW